MSWLSSRQKQLEVEMGLGVVQDRPARCLPYIGTVPSELDRFLAMASTAKRRLRPREATSCHLLDQTTYISCVSGIVKKGGIALCAYWTNLLRR